MTVAEGKSPQLRFNNFHRDFLCLFLIAVFFGGDFSRPERPERLLRSGRGNLHGLGWIYHTASAGFSGWRRLEQEVSSGPIGGFLFLFSLFAQDIRVLFFSKSVRMQNEDRRREVFFEETVLISNLYRPLREVLLDLHTLTLFCDPFPWNLQHRQGPLVVAGKYIPRMWSRWKHARASCLHWDWRSMRANQSDRRGKIRGPCR